MSLRQALQAVGFGALTLASAAQGQWVSSRCDLHPGHVLVNSAVLYLRSARQTKFQDERTKDLEDARHDLEQALTTGQRKNPAAWYYLGRYYVEMKDLAGADSAFTHALALAPACVDDVNTWRRELWVPLINAGVAAWQAGHPDSAIVVFRRANALYAAEPAGFTYLASIFAERDADSAAHYFTLAIGAAGDARFAKERQDAMFNVARVYHRAGRSQDAILAYEAYLAAYPRDLDAAAGLTVLYLKAGKRDEAAAVAATLSERADSASATALFQAAQAIEDGVSGPADTAALEARCRADMCGAPDTLAASLRCESLAQQAIADHGAMVETAERFAAQAFALGLTRNPYDRVGLFALSVAATRTRDTADAVAAAARLYAVDPLNRATLHLNAGAWRLAGNADSTSRYEALADSLVAEVTVATFAPRAHDAELSGVVTNPQEVENRAVPLAFAFLGIRGDVIATVVDTVPPLAAGESRAFVVRATGDSVAAWRYGVAAGP